MERHLKGPLNTSIIIIIVGLLKAHQALTQASWQDAFLGLWMAALRLVQRVKTCLNVFQINVNIGDPFM